MISRTEILNPTLLKYGVHCEQKTVQAVYVVVGGSDDDDDFI